MGCLYRLEFPSGKSYIGVTLKTAALRLKQHVTDARRGDRLIGQAIRKYGAENCRVVTLVISDDFAYLKEMEKRAIAAFGTFRPGGYNSTMGGDGVIDPSGQSEIKRRAKLRETKKRPEVIARLSAVHKAAWDDPEKKALRAQKMREMWANPVYRQMQSERHKGNKPTPETAAKRRAGNQRYWDANRKHPKKAKTPEQEAVLAAIKAETSSQVEMMRRLWEDPGYRDIMLSKRVATQRSPEFRAKVREQTRRKMEDQEARFRIALSLFANGQNTLIKSGANPFRCDSTVFGLWDSVPETVKPIDLMRLGFTARQINSAIKHNGFVIEGTK